MGGLGYYGKLASSPGSLRGFTGNTGGRKRAWYEPFAHARIIEIHSFRYSFSVLRDVTLLLNQWILQTFHPLRAGEALQPFCGSKAEQATCIQHVSEGKDVFYGLQRMFF